ncbi:MAG: ABC transporter permease [Blautia sp.]|nr:ABC transporter permease [Blautia sp.]
MRLLIYMAWEDLRIRYSRSWLGALWAFLSPLLTVLILCYVFWAGYRNPPVGEIPFVLWFTAGYVPWLFISDGIAGGTRCFTEYAVLICKQRFPAQVLPKVRLLSSFIIHCFFLLILLIVRYALLPDTPVRFFHLLYFETAVFLYLLGAGYLLGTLQIFLPDLSDMVGILLQLLFWITPVLWQESGEMRERIGWMLAGNPVRYLVQGFRMSLLPGDGRLPVRSTLLFWSFTGMQLLAGSFLFSRFSPSFADEM